MKSGKTYDIGVGVLSLLLFLISINLIVDSFDLWKPEVTHFGEEVFVQVSGDVVCPGVYGSHHPLLLRDLVCRANGLISGKEETQFPQNALCHTGTSVEVMDNIGVPRIRMGKMPAFYRTTLGIPISINGETADGLTSVPGIGPKMAQKIIRERNRRGGFKSLEDLLSVQGVGPLIYLKLRPWLAL